jgi:tRNA-binding EMAP/Myf-like protein
MAKKKIIIENKWEVLVMGAVFENANIFKDVAKVNALLNKSEITVKESDKMISDLKNRDTEFELEISVIKKNNELGHESFGYGDENKIILWSTDVIAGNDMYTGNIQWCKDVAQLLCNCMNKNNM